MGLRVVEVEAALGALGIEPVVGDLGDLREVALGTIRIDIALLVQEICSPKNALLLLTSVQPSTSSSIVSW